MEILWLSSEPLKISQIQHDITPKLAYTTVATVLNRLYGKKIVTRHCKNKVLFYSPKISKNKFALQALDDLFLRLFDSYGKLTAESFKKISKTCGY